MRRFPLPSALALATVLFFARAPRADTPPRLIERVVAVVDGDPILASELLARTAPHDRELDATRLPAWRRAALRRLIVRSALARLVEERLIEKAAREQGIEVDDADIELALSELAASSALTRDELEIKIVAAGWTFTEYLRELRPQLLERRLLQQRAASLPRWPATAEQWAKERKRWISELKRDAFIELRFSP